MKNEPFCTDRSYWDQVDTKETRQRYKQIATGRLTKHSVAQLVYFSNYNLSSKRAFIDAFNLPIDVCTEEERKAVDFCQEIGENAYIRNMLKRALVDEKFHNNLKVVSELKKYINNNSQLTNNQLPGLTINLTKEKPVEPPANTTNQDQDYKTDPINLSDLNKPQAEAEAEAQYGEVRLH